MQFAKVSRDTKDFISWVLQVDPSKRPSCEDLLKHPWLNAEDLQTAALDNASTLGQYNSRRQSRKVSSSAIDMV